MEKKMTIATLYNAYSVLNAARISGLKNNDDKTRVLKVMRELRPLATKFEADRKEAIEKLKPEGWDELLQRAAAYEREMKDGQKSAVMTVGEYNDFRAKGAAYDRSLAAAMRDEEQKEVTVDIEPLGDGLLTELLTLCDWQTAQYFAVADACGN